MNKENLRIIFMGTPQFAVASLRILIDHGYKVVGVITAPDKPAGRGRKLSESDVKKYALKKNLKVLQPNNLKDEEFLKELRALEANLQVVVAFRMLPKVVWDLPKYGTFNLHASLLPNYRGAAPIHWAIINGEKKTGLTTFFIDEKIDTGEIIDQVEVEIGDTETVGELHDRMMELGSHLVLTTVEKIENQSVTTRVQSEEGTLKSANKLNRDNCKIDWTKDVSRIYNKIRGLNPFPTAWSDFQNGNDIFQVKLFKVNMMKSDHKEDYGSITIRNESIRVAVKNGYIDILEIQLPGKRKMDVKSLLNGFDIHPEAKML